MLDSPRLPDRFWAKVVPEPNSGCYLWTAAVMGKGYGYFHWDGRNQGAHRVAYSILVGPIPEGFEVDHHCQTPLCVNPTHLEVVTSRENKRRQATRRTSCKEGHLFTLESTYTTSAGYRVCRTCHADYERRRRAQPNHG